MFRHEIPTSVGVLAYFPYRAAKTVKISVIVVMVGMTDHDIQTKPGIENKLQSGDLLAAITMGPCVDRGAMADSWTRYMIYIDSRA